MSKEKSLFNVLNSVDVNEFKRKKGKYDYLSWAHAVQELLKVCPDAQWHTHEYTNKDGNTVPYMESDSGCYVRVTVIASGIERSHIHPVLDNYNNTIKEPNAFQVNTSIQRCLAKAIALHGLGLYIFSGEDLPDIDNEPKEEPKMSDSQLMLINNLTKSYSKEQKDKLIKWVDSKPTSLEASKKIDALKKAASPKQASFESIRSNSAT